jgi:hypothetical protein
MVQTSLNLNRTFRTRSPKSGPRFIDFDEPDLRFFFFFLIEFVLRDSKLSTKPHDTTLYVLRHVTAPTKEGVRVFYRMYSTSPKNMVPYKGKLC